MSSPPERIRHGDRQWRADGLLLLVALIWGSTFVLVKQSVAQFPVFAFLSLRFLLAAVALLPILGQRLLSCGAETLRSGFVVGLALFGGYAFQTAGLRYTTASKAGFITGLSVVIVPLLSAALLARRPSSSTTLGVVLCTTGLGLLTLGRDLHPSPGDLLVLGCALCFALHIVTVGLFAPRNHALTLTWIQVAVVALLSAAASMVTEDWPNHIPRTIWLSAAFTGVLATALAFGVQNAVQRSTTATHTAVIFATEPVFAAVFGLLLAGERFTSAGLLGSALILCGMLVAEMRPAAPADPMAIDRREVGP